MGSIPSVGVLLWLTITRVYLCFWLLITICIGSISGGYIWGLVSG